MNIILSLILISFLNASDIEIDLKNIKNETNTPTPKISITKTNNLEIEKFINEMERILGGEEKPIERQILKNITQEKILYNLNLNLITDKYLKTNITFKTGKGTDVMLSVSKASNCPDGSTNCKDSDKFLLAFTYYDKTSFIKIKDIINLGIFMSGSKNITIDGETYNAKVNASITDVNSSQIIIKGPKGIVLDKKLGEMLDVFGSFGAKIVLNKEYRVVYGRKIVCSQGVCGFSNDKMAFIMEYPVGKDSAYYSIDEKTFNGRSVYFETIGKQFFFKLTDGILTVTKSD